MCRQPIVKTLNAKLLAAALLIAVLPVTSAIPARAQAEIAIGFQTFHDRLASYGDWLYSDRWGEVWVPDNVPEDFHPYSTNGRWIYTQEYGSVWATDYEWGDITFHYGRWVNDPADGWLWIPGYIWSPGWVVWRANNRYLGWMPLPPDDDFLRGNENASFRYSFGGRPANFNDTTGYYGYSRWFGPAYDEARFARNWVFIDSGHIGDAGYDGYSVIQAAEVAAIVRKTHDVTNYAVVNNYIVNRSVELRAGGRPGGQALQVRQASDALKNPAFIRTVDSGARLVTETPHGTGIANSAPRPSPAVIQTLSAGLPKYSGRSSGHLFTKDSVRTAPWLATAARRTTAAELRQQRVNAVLHPQGKADRGRDNGENSAAHASTKDQKNLQSIN